MLRLRAHHRTRKPFSSGYSSPQNGHFSSSRARGQSALYRDPVRQLGLGPPADGAARRRPAQLARDLLDDLEGRRRLILTSRTFAPDRRTYDSLPAELGAGQERFRQLQTSALQVLAGQPATIGTARCAGALYRPHDPEAPALPRSPAHHRDGRGAVLAGRNPPDARVVHPQPARPAASALIMRARAFRASLVISSLN